MIRLVKRIKRNGDTSTIKVEDDGDNVYVESCIGYFVKKKFIDNNNKKDNKTKRK